MAASFSAFLNIVILDVFYPSLLIKCWYKKIHFCPIFMRWTYLLPNAITGFRYSSPFVSWRMQKALCPLFWFKSLRVDPSASIIFSSVDLCPNWLRFPPLYFLKNVVHSVFCHCLFFNRWGGSVTTGSLMQCSTKSLAVYVAMQK